MRIKLDEVIKDIAAGPFGSNLKVECFTSSGFPIVDGANLKGVKVTDNITKFVSEEKARSLSRSIAKKGDVVVTISGTVGQIAYIPKDSKYNEYLVSQRQFRVSFDEDQVYVPYLVYYFHTREGQSKILAFKNQTGVPALAQPLKNFKNIEIDLPSLEFQKKQINLIERMQAKIDLNNQINKNLAEQIQAFLNYVLSTGNENDAVRFGDLLYIKGRIGWKGLKKDEYLANSDYRIINGESLTPEGIDWTKTGFITQERYDESPEIMLKLGDILLSKDGTIGKIGYIDKLDLPTTVASGIFVIRNSTKGEYGTPFLYYLLTSNRFKGFIKARTEGSVIPHLYQKDFMEFTFPKPDPELLKQFNEFSQPLFETIQNKIRENRQLAILRDKLLAKLLSGDIEIQ